MEQEGQVWYDCEVRTVRPDENRWRRRGWSYGDDAQFVLRTLTSNNLVDQFNCWFVQLYYLDLYSIYFLCFCMYSFYRSFCDSLNATVIMFYVFWQFVFSDISESDCTDLRDSHWLHSFFESLILVVSIFPTSELMCSFRIFPEN